MRGWLTWLWCALRSHPYPLQLAGGVRAYRNWLDRDTPFMPGRCCSNCGAVQAFPSRGMHS